EWQNSEKQRQVVAAQEAFWLKQFDGELPVLELPMDFPRPVERSYDGSRKHFGLDCEETQGLKTLAISSGATFFMTLLALLNVLLAKLSGKEDIVIGTPSAGRGHVDLDKIIGIFVNTLVLKNSPVGDKIVGEFIKEVKENALQAFANQDYPYDELVEKILVKRDAGRNPLFDIMFSMQNIETMAIEIPGLKLAAYEYESNTVKFDLTLIVVEVEEKLQLTFEYSKELFKPETIERFIFYFKNIARSVVENKNRTISDLEILSEEEKNRILNAFNKTGAVYPKNKTIQQLFEEQVEKSPDSIALVGTFSVGSVQPVNLTYRQLNVQSNRLAGLLIEKGVQPDTIVGIMMERSIDLIIGILGILKVGCAYMPINPGNPPERIAFMLKDSSAKILLTANEITSFSTKCVFNFHHSSCIVHHSSHLAYLIYTSGSTGNPKGVPITHANLCPLLHWGYEYLGFGPKDKVLQNLSYYFDWSVWEIFITLTTGAELYMVSEELALNPRNSILFMKENDIAVLHVTPTQYLHVIGDGHKLETLKYLFLGAEKLTVDLMKRSFASVPGDCRVFNMYGPTETTIISAVLEIKRGDESRFEALASVPIGGPVANGPLLVLDKYLNLCPVNVPGELNIGGDGVARGYLNNPELTAERFIEYRSYNSYKTYILYKTGDLCRWLPDGNIEFLGRIDQQIKIRGFRVEPGEIENRLLNYPGIKEVVVLVREEDRGGKYLCAYVVSEREYGISELREYLAMGLPDYMVPSYFVPLEKIPLTPNGKVDREALPEPGLKSGESYAAPRDAVEMKLVELWSEVLGRDALHGAQLQTSIGIHDNFFELGGHSLKSVLLVAKIHKELNTKIPLEEVFRTPTIEGLARYIRGASRDVYAAIEPIEKKEYYDLSHAQKRLWVLNRLEKNLVAYNIPAHIQLENLNRGAFEKAVEVIVRRHEILKTTFINVNGEPKQKVHLYEDLYSKLNYLDLRKEENREQIIDILKEKEKNTPFDLETGPLLRTKLLHLGESRFLFLYTLHHIISDGWSMDVMKNEFMTLYEVYCNGKENPLPPLLIQYKDYTHWHLKQLSGENLRKHQDYWLSRFAGNIPVLELPTDYPRTELRSFAGEFILFSLSADVTEQLKRICKEFGTTLFITLLSVVNVFLYRYTGQTDIIVGTPAAGREHKDLENQIGFYVNMLPLRNKLKKGQSFREVLQMVNRSTLEALEHQVYPFDRLVHELKTAKDMGRNPLVDVVVSFVNADDQTTNTKSPDSNGTNGGDDLLESGAEASKHDLRLRFIERGDALTVHIRYNPRLFKKERILVIKERFVSLINDIISNVDKEIDNLNFL
ncbi:MAG TPA: amino acid adenylation domain-containing protein, partial [Candidatus Deferrimicrobium sp.]|nr:amino acid adenylation domain-containing protein [Candidatus Deferrimicrobium sp.]